MNNLAIQKVDVIPAPGDIIISNVNQTPLKLEDDWLANLKGDNHFGRNFYNGFKVGYILENLVEEIRTCFSPMETLILGEGALKVSGSRFLSAYHDEVRILNVTKDVEFTKDGTNPFTIKSRKKFTKTVNVWVMETSVQPIGYERFTDEELIALLENTPEPVQEYFRSAKPCDSNLEEEKLRASKVMRQSLRFQRYFHTRDMYASLSNIEQGYIRNFNTEEEFVTWAAKHMQAAYEPEYNDKQITIK